MKGASSERARRMASDLMEAYNSMDIDGFRGDFDRVMNTVMDPGRTKDFIRAMRSNYGDFVSLGKVRTPSADHFVFPVTFERGSLDLKLVLGPEDRISGLWFLPRTGDLDVPDRNRTELMLPFEDMWYVVWGGDTREMNRHHDIPSQRFAIDLVVLGKDGASHVGDGRNKEDYHCFGREVLAPGDGKVVEAIDGVRDCEPGYQNPFTALGNSVTIEHAEDEYSLFAHFKRGSVSVEAGDEVRQGRVIGLCGNSGLSYEPHIHYHIMNTSLLNRATGIRPFFKDVAVLRKGERVEKDEHSPRKGDRLMPL